MPKAGLSSVQSVRFHGGSVHSVSVSARFRPPAPPPIPRPPTSPSDPAPARRIPQNGSVGSFWGR
eukprot:13355397-Alexandrium_andersonii.AAC.1